MRNNNVQLRLTLCQHCLQFKTHECNFKFSVSIYRNEKNSFLLFFLIVFCWTNKALRLIENFKSKQKRTHQLHFFQLNTAQKQQQPLSLKKLERIPMLERCNQIVIHTFCSCCCFFSTDKFPKRKQKK